MDDNLDYPVVGTGIVLHNDPESSLGRLLFFHVSSASGRAVFTLAAEHASKGVGYCLAPFHDRLLACFNSLVRLVSVSRGDGGLKVQEDVSYHGKVLVLRQETRGGFDLARDMRRSVTLLRNQKMGGSGLEPLSRDYDAAWTMTMEFISDDNFQSCRCGNEQESAYFAPHVVRRK